MRRSARYALTTWLLLTAFAVFAMAQAPVGTISGTVTDPSGAVIRNAAVNIRNKATNIERQLRSVLESRMVVRIPAEGTPFDPEQHEAIGSVDTSEHPEGIVVEEIEPGYKMGGKVIRPARVKVARRP